MVEEVEMVELIHLDLLNPDKIKHHPAQKLQFVNRCAKAAENFLDGAQAIYFLRFTGLAIIFEYRRGLAFINFDAVADDAFVVVVAAARCFATQQDTLGDFFVVHVECDER